MNMSTKMTFLAALLLMAQSGAAAAACADAIAQFETIINSDVETGNLSKSVYRRIVAELGTVKAKCAAGHDGEAMRALGPVKSRHGYW
jgi:hypothetical protein